MRKDDNAVSEGKEHHSVPSSSHASAGPSAASKRNKKMKKVNSTSFMPQATHDQAKAQDEGVPQEKQRESEQVLGKENCRFARFRVFWRLVEKCAKVFVRRKMQMVLMLATMPFMVVVDFLVARMGKLRTPIGDDFTFDACGYIAVLDNSTVADWNKQYYITNLYYLRPLILSVGPVFGGLAGSRYIFDEARTTLTQSLIASGNSLTLFWISWFTVLVGAHFLSCLFASGLAIGLPESDMNRVDYGSVLITFFLTSVACLLGIIVLFLMFGFKVNSTCRNRVGLFMIVTIVTFGLYLLTASVGILIPSPNVWVPHNTTRRTCLSIGFDNIQKVSHVGASVASVGCESWDFCDHPLIIGEDQVHNGCWYEASSSELIWNSKLDVSNVFVVLALFMFPTFHFAQILALMQSVTKFKESSFDGNTLFYMDPRQLISHFTGLKEDQVILTSSTSRELGNITFDRGETLNCETTPLSFWNTETDALMLWSPSFGASLGFLTLLMSFYLLVIWLISHFLIERKQSRYAVNSRGCDRPMAVENLSVKRSGKNKGMLLHGIHCTLARGQMMCLFGKNNCGKSAFIQTLAGTFNIDRNCSLRLPLDVGICHELDLLFPELTTLEHLVLFGRMWYPQLPESDLNAKVEEWMQRLHLEEFKNKPVAQLSIGRRRRVSIAVATIGEPSLVLLDDATCGSCPVNQRYIWKHLSLLKTNAQSAILMTSHSMQDVETMADQILILDQGRVLTFSDIDGFLRQFGDACELHVMVETKNEFDFETFKTWTKENLQPEFPSHVLYMFQQKSSRGKVNICFIRHSDENKTELAEKMVKHLLALPTSDGNPIKNVLRIGTIDMEKSVMNALAMTASSTGNNTTCTPLSTTKTSNARFWQQFVGLTTKNIRERLLNVESAIKYIVAISFIIGISLSGISQNEVQTDTVLIVAVIMLYSGFYLPHIVMEINEGYLQMLKLHGCRFSSYLASETFLVFASVTVVSFVALSLMTHFGQDIYDDALSIACFAKTKDYPNNSGKHPCYCFFGGDEENLYDRSYLQAVESYIVTNEAGNLGVLFVISILGGLGVTGTVLMLVPLFRNYQRAAVFGSILIVAFALTPSLLLYEYDSREVLKFPINVSTCSDVTVVTSSDYYFVSDQTDWEDRSCVSRTLRLGSVAYNILVPVGFFMSLSSFFYSSTRVVSNTGFSCHSDNHSVVMENILVFALGSLCSLVFGIICFKLRSYPPKWFLEQKKSHSIRKHKHREEKSENRLSFDQEIEEQDQQTGKADNRGKKSDNREKLAVSTHRLCKRFSSKTELGPVTIDFTVGENIAISGPNGSSKTTLLEILTGNIAPSSGDAQIFGKDVETEPNGIYQPGNLGYVPQKKCLWNQLTVSQHLSLVARMEGINETILFETARRFGLSEKSLLGTRVRDLSNGMSERLAIVLAVANEPRLLIMDEVTNNLDPDGRDTLFEIFHRYRMNPASSLIVTTHSMEEAEQMADRVAILSKGKVKAIDTPGRMKERFGSGFTMVLKVKPGSQKQVFHFIRENACEQAVLGNFVNNVLRINLPRKGFDLSKAFRVMMEHDHEMICQWTIFHATMLDSYINIAGSDEAELKDIGFLNENEHGIVVKLLRHKGFEVAQV